MSPISVWLQIFQILDKDKDGMFSTLDVEQLAEDDLVSIECRLHMIAGFQHCSDTELQTQIDSSKLIRW